MNRNYAIMPRDTDLLEIEARLFTKWEPEGEYGDDVAMTATLEHATQICIQMK